MTGRRRPRLALAEQIADPRVRPWNRPEPPADAPAPKTVGPHPRAPGACPRCGAHVERLAVHLRQCQGAPK